MFETTPARRTEFSWLNARGLRNGAISYRNSTLALAQLYAALGGGWQAFPPYVAIPAPAPAPPSAAAPPSTILPISD